MPNYVLSKTIEWDGMNINCFKMFQKQNNISHKQKKVGNGCACRNSFFCVFGIFLSKKSSLSSKFQRGNLFTWPTFSHFVIHLE
jgi:hypothetical protein